MKKHDTKLIKQAFIALLSFIGSLAKCIQCIYLNDEPCLATPTLIDLNSTELYYFCLV